MITGSTYMDRWRAVRAERRARGTSATRYAVLGALHLHCRLNDEQVAQVTGLPLRVVAPELRRLHDAGVVVRASGGRPGSFRLPNTSERRRAAAVPTRAGV